VPAAQYLKSCGATPELLLPFISVIQQEALSEGIDLKTAVTKLTQELNDYRQLGTLQNAITILNQQLTALSDLTTEKQHAMTLLNLKASG